MDSIIVALETASPNMDIIGFACYVAELTGSALTATFVVDSAYQLETAESSLVSSPVQNTLVTTGELRQIDQNSDLVEKIEVFRKACLTRNISNEVRVRTGTQFIEDSRFADLIIADPRLATNAEIPAVQTRTLLSRTECPVLLAPGSYTEITEIIHCYDGSQTAVHAIKLFTYLFPDLLDIRCILLQVNKEPDWSVEKKEEMQRWLKTHYSQAGFNVIQGNIDEGLYSFLKNRKGALITMGAYGRNSVSIMLKESRADNLIRSLNLPIFISH